MRFYLRDTMFNRGPSGAAWVLQKALGVQIDQEGTESNDAARRLEQAEVRPAPTAQQACAAREAYERLRRDESSPFWQGLVNRWNKAKADAVALVQPTPELPETAPRGAADWRPWPSAPVGTMRCRLTSNSVFGRASRAAPSFAISATKSGGRSGGMLNGFRALRNGVASS